MYSPYSNKFENPLHISAKDYFFEIFLLLVVNLDKRELSILIAHKGDMHWW
jgi:hypothetical protein